LPRHLTGATAGCQPVDLIFCPFPEGEAFIRIQHRSGGYGTVAKIDAANADTVGIRWKF
jgi:hypothetical protein